MRLLEMYPDLGAGLKEEELEEARKLAVPALRIERGSWTPTAAELRDGGAGEPLCLLVACGLLFRITALGERRSSVVAGEGDILPIPNQGNGRTATIDRFVVAEPSIVALLDGSFLAAARRWPALTAEVVRRLSDQLRRAAAELAISHLPRTEDRVLALAWQLAERFGDAGKSGVTLRMRLTHDTIGTLIGAERSTVTLAIRRLEREGLLQRSDGLIQLRYDSRGRFGGDEAQEGISGDGLRTSRRPAGRLGMSVATEPREPAIVEEAIRSIVPARNETDGLAHSRSEADVAAIVARLQLANEFASSAIRRSQQLCERSERYRAKGATIVTTAEKLADLGGQ